MSDLPAHRRSRARRDWSWWLATVGGIGCVPRMPGTAGTLAGCAVWALTSLLPQPLYWHAALLLLLLPLGILASSRAEHLLGVTDPHEIVIDEFVAVFITFFALRVSAPALLTGFAANRVFDILKPFPINRLQRLPRGWGIMADDVAAGLASAAVVRVAMWLC